jgi:formylglycine-generating enzyme required for sulfatase activity
MHKNIRIMLRLKDSEKGFALLAAIMACLVLLALGMLVISLSTQDIKVSTKIVGDKRSLAAAEEGIHNLSQTFNPVNPLAAPVTNARLDGTSSYTIFYPATRPATGPEMVPVPGGGFAIGGSSQWALRRYNIDVGGNNTEYNTQVRVGVGVGYGPIEMSTMSR